MARSASPWGALAALGALFGTLTAVAVAGRASARVAAPPNRRIALIGDSYAVGLGPQLADLLPEFRFEGHVGTSTAQWAAHSPACGECGDWLTRYAPAVVLVALGVNDDGSPNPANYHAIVSALHGIGARVVWIEPPAGVQHVGAVRKVIAGLGVPVVPATQTPLAKDSVHPVSYGPWAQEVAGHVT